VAKEKNSALRSLLDLPAVYAGVLAQNSTDKSLQGMAAAWCV
jgi:hypothetical protein